MLASYASAESAVGVPVPLRGLESFFWGATAEEVEKLLPRPPDVINNRQVFTKPFVLYRIRDVNTLDGIYDLAFWFDQTKGRFRRLQLGCERDKRASKERFDKVAELLSMRLAVEGSKVLDRADEMRMSWVTPTSHVSMSWMYFPSVDQVSFVINFEDPNWKDPSQQKHKPRKDNKRAHGTFGP